MGDERKGFADLEQVLELYNITNKDIEAIQSYTDEAKSHLKAFIKDFYIWLPRVPEYAELFSSPQLVEQVKHKQAVYWDQLFECKLNDAYLQSRFKVGDVHATINLPISSYVAGMSFAADWWMSKITGSSKVAGKAAQLIVSLNKLFILDIALISASYMQASNELIEMQNQALLELSAPTIELWDDVLVLPILGIIDSRRAQDMTDVMLKKIQQTNASSVIVDITGVPTVDTSVANHLIKITKATRLMGCECVLSGIGPEIAQTLVHLGINLEAIVTSSTLKSALQFALNKAGYMISQNQKQNGMRLE